MLDCARGRIQAPTTRRADGCSNTPFAIVKQKAQFDEREGSARPQYFDDVTDTTSARPDGLSVVVDYASGSSNATSLSRIRELAADNSRRQQEIRAVHRRAGLGSTGRESDESGK